MEKNYVEIQGRFSSDGKFMDGKYVPGIVDELLDSVSGAFNDTTGLHRLRVTVEVEDLGADVKFGKPASETQHSPAPQRLTVGKLMRNICRDEYQKEAARLDRIGDIVPLLRQMAGIAGFEIIGRIPLRDKATGKEYR